MTKEKLSEKIGVARQALSNWESITSPNLEPDVLLSKELKINLNELVDNELDILCKDNFSYSILNHLVGKTCAFEFDDSCFAFDGTLV